MTPGEQVRQDAKVIPHVWALPWRKRLRLYLGGVASCERYEAGRRERILRRWIARG